VTEQTLAGRYGSLAQIRADLLTVVAAGAFIALLAQIRIPLPFTPVPVTGQTLGVLVAGMALGRRRGSGAVLLYLLGGALGLPVFTGFGSGLAYLSGPTGGYLLLGFPVAAWLLGLTTERRWTRAFHARFVLMLAGGLLICSLGAVWLGIYVGFGSALTLGVLPFLPGELLKAALGATSLPVVRRFAGRGC